MAKKSNNDRAQLRVFIIAGIVLTVFILAVGFMGYQLYKSTQKISLKSQVVSSSLNRIDNNLLLMNRDVLMIINGSGDIASEINEIAFLFDEIEEQMKQRESAEKKRVSKLARLYNGMKPKDAAEAMDALDDDLAVTILQKMDEGTASKVLSEFEPAKAARLTQIIYEGTKKNLQTAADIEKQMEAEAKQGEGAEPNNEKPAAQ